MCGIAGYRTGDRVDSTQMIRAMLDEISHRGPDHSAYFHDGNVSMGYNRLSIMDLYHGNQPFNNENNSIKVVFNGEIYNYRELLESLQSKGHKIDNNSDGCIIPHMYEEYGEELFLHLNGQFAISIWDSLNRKIILARDRLGEKPLYYYKNGQDFCFASEIKGIFASGMVQGEFSPRSLGRLFFYGTPLDNMSIFKNVYSLNPGSYLVLKNDEINIMTYWSFSFIASFETRNNHNEEYLLNELEEIMVNAVERNMQSHVPVSAYLSGGLDSSLVTAIMAKKLNSTIDSYSICFHEEDFDESYYQDIVSDCFHTNPHKVYFSEEEIPDLIKEVVYHTEVPIFTPGAIGMYKLSTVVKEHNKKVVLDGQGADELFGGYSWFKDSFLVKKDLEEDLSSSIFEERFLNYFKDVSMKELYGPQLNRWLTNMPYDDIFQNEYRMRHGIFEEIYLKDIIKHNDFKKLTPLQRQQYLSIIGNLPNYNLSTLGDNVAMANGIEIRHPFLDIDVLTFASKLPDSLKIKHMDEKYLLKRLAKKYLPAQIVERRKKPYKAPLQIRKIIHHPIVKEYLSIDALKSVAIFNVPYINTMLERFRTMDRNDSQDTALFLGVLSTQILYEQMILKYR